jgi:hypothetical protein
MTPPCGGWSTRALKLTVSLWATTQLHSRKWCVDQIVPLSPQLHKATPSLDYTRTLPHTSDEQHPTRKFYAFPVFHSHHTDSLTHPAHHTNEALCSHGRFRGFLLHTLRRRRSHRLWHLSSRMRRHRHGLLLRRWRNMGCHARRDGARECAGVQYCIRNVPGGVCSCLA